MQALNTPPSFSHPILASHLNMASLSSGAALPQFIGAVEDHWQLFSDRSSDYAVGAPIGFGASSIVYAALYHPPNRQPTPCALKVLDLDTLPLHSWSLLQRETTLMSLSKHPNVLRVRGSWMDGHKLFIALRLMNKGSAADVMRYGWPGGLEEDVIKCILEQALQGLNYLHINGFIHRDVKAANLLIDDDGTVLLGDLGVAADLAEGSSHTLSSLSQNDDKSAVDQKSLPSHALPLPSNRVLIDATPSSKTPRIGKRKSFVGTPCWMAPELIQGKQYDSSADIWSFGITALELTQGRPPRSREPPQKVLLRTIQDEPPTLDREGGLTNIPKRSKRWWRVVSSKTHPKDLQRKNYFKHRFSRILRKSHTLSTPYLKIYLHWQSDRSVELYLIIRSTERWILGISLSTRFRFLLLHLIRSAGASIEAWRSN
ncbi:kinase-like domain-containing protein [Lentinula raphanica]|nr:kinase-like domain-containing protein [Lentinula raphanica]